ncbi:MAG: aldo/keto reductase [Gammaproteobacteria bacterium]|nr:aldo/keto reductase [Gammaproteobacteria bacterium]
MDSVHASLKRLNTDYIDLYWAHAWDPLTPVEELMRGLDDLVSQGKVLYVGISDTPAWVVSRANTCWPSCAAGAASSACRSAAAVIDRTVERELLPMSRALDLAVTPWGIVGSGVLSGKYGRSTRRPRVGRAPAVRSTTAHSPLPGKSSPLRRKSVQRRRR